MFSMSTATTYYPYIAVIGDIKDSRNLGHRKANQQKFTKTLARLNHVYQKDIAAQFTVSMGDAFQGLLKDASHLMVMLFELELSLAPIELRIGIGLGDIETELNTESSLLNDGSSYHRARAMIEQIERSEKQYEQCYSNILLSTGGQAVHYEKLINTIFSLESVIKTKWTERQKEIIRTYLANEKNQYMTAEALNIGQSSVNKALNSAEFYTFNNSLITLQNVINEL